MSKIEFPQKQKTIRQLIDDANKKEKENEIINKIKNGIIEVLKTYEVLYGIGTWKPSALTLEKWYYYNDNNELIHSKNIDLIFNDRYSYDNETKIWYTRLKILVDGIYPHYICDLENDEFTDKLMDLYE